MQKRSTDIIPHANNALVVVDGEGGAGGGGGGGGTHSACASCKHQRKKCAEDCILAPVFPAERTREFQAVHKVFGVSNVIKMMRRVADARDRERVAESLAWEAASREKDPVLGALGLYRRVQEEKQQMEKELALYKSQSSNSNINGNNINSSHNNHHHHHVSSQLSRQTNVYKPNGGWSNNNSNGSVSVVTSNGSSNGGNNSNSNSNMGGMLQVQVQGVGISNINPTTGFTSLHGNSSNHHHHQGDNQMMISSSSKVNKVEDGGSGSFIARPQPQQQHHLIQGQHQLLHQPPFNPFYGHIEHHLSIPGQYNPAGFNFNGQAMENNNL